jgi:hypothetical protein
MPAAMGPEILLGLIDFLETPASLIGHEASPRSKQGKTPFHEVSESRNCPCDNEIEAPTMLIEKVLAVDPPEFIGGFILEDPAGVFEKTFVFPPRVAYVGPDMG